MNQSGGKDVRTRVIETLQKYKIKQIDVARQTGMHHSTLCLWLQGKIKGHQVKTEETLMRWLENFDENKSQLIPKATTSKTFGGKASEHREAVPEVEKVDPILSALSKEDELIPVRIDVDSDGRRYKDNIYWNLNETLMTPEHFAKQIADDNGLAPTAENEIVMSIRKAIQSYRRYVPGLPELIRIIELDIRVDNVCLKDRFEWDINDPNNNPEEFALGLCNELGLDFEFMCLIAHSIREQIQTHQRQAIDRGLADFRAGDEFMQMQMKKSTRSLLESSQIINRKNLEQVLITEDNYLRNLGTETGNPHDINDVNRWEPRIEVLDPEEIARIKKLEDRKNRYEKRHR